MGIPSPQLTIHLRSIHAISSNESMEVGFITSHMVMDLSPKSSMDAYMATLLEVRFKNCAESWVKQKATPNL